MKVLFLALGLFSLGVSFASADPVSSPAPAASPAAATPGPTKRVELYSLDFDDNANLFLISGTKKPFTGAVVSTGDNGRTELVGTVTDGLRSGWWVEYAENGQKTSEGTRKNDVEDGPWTYWSDNGQMTGRGTFKDGSPVGLWETFFEDGKPDSSGIYKDGLMDGPWVFHDEKTGQARTIPFDMGVQLKK